MPDEMELGELDGEPIGDGYVQDITLARKGLRTCLSCRVSFPNHLAVVKHQLHGCKKATKAAKR
jgi:hypothetical protein